ncbi:MAG: DUF3352 domain-containing protein [Pyrinomonadaceae bacterium]|nr:DUF3352 domain-containing protein [Pyrinomonadaceae bacterium]
MKLPDELRMTALLLTVVCLMASFVPAQRRRTPPRSKPAAPTSTNSASSKPASTKPPATKSAPTSAAPVPASATAIDPDRQQALLDQDFAFDEIVASDTYAVYGEVRRVGQLISAGNVIEMFQPFESLVSSQNASFQMTSTLQFLTKHAELLADANMSFAMMPTRRGVPEAVSALRLPSVEAARTFEPQLRKYLTTLPGMGAPAETSAGVARTSKKRRAHTNAALSPQSRFTIKRYGSMLMLSDAPFNLKALKSESGTTFSDDERLQRIRGRLASEQLFVYVNTDLIERYSKLTREESEAQMVAAQKVSSDVQMIPNVQRAGRTPNDSEVTETGDIANQGTAAVVGTNHGTGVVVGVTKTDSDSQTATVTGTIQTEADKQDALLTEEETKLAEDEAKEVKTVEAPPANDGVSLNILGGLLGGITGGMPEWPEAVGVGVGFEGSEYLVRVLVDNGAEQRQPGRSPLIPFLPFIIPGPPVLSEASSIAPATSEMLFSISLDAPRIFEELVERADAAKLQQQSGENRAPVTGQEKEPTLKERMASLETKYKFRIKEEFLATLGHEVAVSAPLSYFGMSRRGSGRRSAKDSDAGIVVLISLKDREAFRAMLPRVFDAVGMKAIFDLARTEKQGDVEILSIADFSIAFVNNFLVVAPDGKSVRRVVDAYTNGTTLGGDETFRAATGWEPNQKLAQVYISPKLMEGMLADLRSMSAQGDPEVKELIGNLSVTADAITYAASGDDQALMHELHLPKGLIKLFASSASVAIKQAPLLGSESRAMYSLTTIAEAEESYKSKGKSGYATLDELKKKKLIPAGLLDNSNYKIDLTVSGDSFEATATPIEYGGKGRRSFFIDESGKLRGADHGGKRATVSDEPID